MKHNIIILLGIQGSGKGTMSALMREHHDYTYIETGAIFRGLNRDNPVDAEILGIMASGALVPDDMTCKLVESRMDVDHDILTDGFPRTRPQAEFLVDWAIKHDFGVKAVLLNIPDDVVMARIQSRINDGAGRKDDTDPAAIAKRIAEYHEKTEPMINFLRTTPGVQFFAIDATMSIDAVFKSVEEKVG
ncbi:MAG: nucleoside monophosphate kinase [Proteobacteria bacterium]|nr:nucleoside monophosphate kinase [Pseudomonadota bacterium]